MPKKIILMGFDITLAVHSRRMLLLESHTFEECKQLVWDPTQKLLLELAKQKPKSLLCLAEKPFVLFDGKNLGVRADIVGPQKTIAHIGTVVDRNGANANWQWFLSAYKDFPDKIEKLKALGPMTVVRSSLACNIPADCVGINEHTLEKGIENYMGLFVPELAKLPVTWLPKKTQAKLEALIIKEARYLARPQTNAERMEIVRRDIFDSEI